MAGAVGVAVPFLGSWNPSAKAKAAGLWNFFLPDAQSGEGLANLDYASTDTKGSNFFSGGDVTNTKNQIWNFGVAVPLQKTGGNKSRAAKLLEISYPSLLSKIEEYEIDENKRE